jgi:hypothetical protein
MGFLFGGRDAAADLDAVRAKLAEAEAAEVAAEAALRDGALAAALSPDPLAAEPQREALRRARDRVELLQHAAAAAEDAERQAVAKARAALRTSQNRSIRQKISALTKAAAAYQEGTAQCVAAYRDMLAAGEAIKRLLPREFDNFAAIVSPGPLEKACLSELARVGAHHPMHPGAPPNAPGAEWYGHDGAHGSARDLPPLADRLRDRLLQQYQRLIGSSALPVAVPEPSRSGKPRTATAPIPATRAAGQPAQILPAEPVWNTSADAPAALDLSKIHPNDPEARAGFLAEMALLRGAAAPVGVDPAVEAGEAEPMSVEAAPVMETAEAAVADPVEVDPAELVAVEAHQPGPSVGQIMYRHMRRGR